MPRRAADLIVDCLAAHGVTRVFCVPGESYLAVLDALHDSNAIQTIVCRHESGAGFMGVGDAKVTAKPGVAFVSRGPGATNASIAVHVAEQDAVPLHAVRRPGAARRDRPALVPGGGLRQDVRRHGQGRACDPRRVAHPRNRGARVRRGASADARPRGGRAAGGHAGGQHGGRRHRAADRAARGSGLRRRYRGDRGADRPGPSGRCCWRAAVGSVPRAAAGPCWRRRRPWGFRWRSPSSGRTTSQTAIPTTRGISASRSRRRRWRATWSPI